ncbi:hypothetical protein GM182_05850 [bacterium 3DAC]|nr:hypothetical protein GM182_05850 [bacterium 3DAC]
MSLENTLEYKYYKVAVDTPLIGERSVFTYRSLFLLHTGDLVVVPVGKGDAPKYGVVVGDADEVPDTLEIKEILQVAYQGLFPHWYVEFVLDVSDRLLIPPFNIFLISYDKTLMDISRIRLLMYTGKDCPISKSPDFNILVSDLQEHGYLLWRDVKKRFGSKAGRLWKRLKDAGCGEEIIGNRMYNPKVSASVWLVCQDKEYPLEMALVSFGKKAVSHMIGSGKCKIVYYVPSIRAGENNGHQKGLFTIKGTVDDVISLVMQMKGKVAVVVRNRSVAVGLAKKMAKAGVSRVISPTLNKEKLLSYVVSDMVGVFVVPTGYIFKPWYGLDSIIFYDIDDISIPFRDGGFVRVPDLVPIVSKYVDGVYYISPFPVPSIAHISDNVDDSYVPDNITIVDKPKEEVLHRETVERMKDIIEQGGRVLVYASRLGYRTAVLCRSCGYVQRCPVCGFTMVYHLKEDTMICHRCGHREPSMSVCPKCGSSDIVMVGTGIELVESELRQIFGDMLCVQSSNQRRKCPESSSIVLATFRFYRYFVGDRFDIVYIPDMDFMWAIPEYTVWEETMRRVHRLAMVGKEVVIATNIADIWKERLEEGYRSFVDREIGERKLLSFPPYVSILHMEYGSENYKDIKAKVEHFYEILVSSKLGDVWTPEFIGRYQKDGLYRWMIRMSVEEISPDLVDFIERTHPLKYYLSTL